MKRKRETIGNCASAPEQMERRLFLAKGTLATSNARIEAILCTRYVCRRSKSLQTCSGIAASRRYS